MTSKRLLVDLDAVEKVDKARTAGEWFRDQDGAFRTTIEDELGTRERTIHASRYPGEEGKTWAGEVDAAFVIMASKTMGPICEALREQDTVIVAALADLDALCALPPARTDEEHVKRAHCVANLLGSMGRTLRAAVSS